MMPKKPSVPARLAENTRYFSRRLLDALQSMLTNPLTVVEAPMGYGKTEAVREFLHTARAIWTTAQESAQESFWPDFCRGLGQEHPKNPEVKALCAALESLGLPHDLAQIRAGLELIRKIPFRKKTFLVFDDCHYLPRSFFDFCEMLAGERLQNLHVVCITRPGVTGGKHLRPQHSPSNIDRFVFTLTPLEVREFFALYGVSPGLEEVRELHTKTGGWISALRLALLWYRADGDFASIPAKIGDHMKEAMHKAVYAPLSGPARDVLFAVAPLERFTAAEASRLYGARGITALLAELTDKNAFVVFDPKSRIYSVHAIFRQFLLGLFHDDAIVPPQRRQDIYRACGEVFMDAGELAAAMEMWYHGKNFERAMEVMQRDMRRNLVTERAGLYVDMFRDCPEEILERHMGAAFKYAIAAFSAGEMGALKTQLAWLGKRCMALPEDAAGLCPERPQGATEDAGPPMSNADRKGDHWRGELHVLLALTRFNDIDAMIGHHKIALAFLKGEKTSLYGKDSPWTLGSPSVLFMFYRESGKLADALRLLRECMPIYHQLASHHGAGGEHLMEAEALYYAGAFAEAGSACQFGLGMAERHEQLGNVFCARFLQMRLALLAGDAEALFGRGEKSGLLEDMRSMITRGSDYFMLHTADVCEGWLYAALGLHDRIPGWLRSELGSESRLYAFARGYYFIVHGRALLLAGEHAGVIGLFSGMIQAKAFAINLLFSVYGHIYLAAAYEKTGRRQEAASALKTALDTALPDALYMPFAENFDLIGPVLKKALSGEKHEKALAGIENLAEQMRAGREAVLKKVQAANPSALLTERELEVARLVVEGLSNKEIAEKLSITERTVKAHLTHIFGKTGVQSRSGLHKIIS